MSRVTTPPRPPRRPRLLRPVPAGQATLASRSDAPKARPTTRRPGFVAVATPAILTAACLGGLGGAGCARGYDVEFDCRQTLTCCRELGDPLPTTLAGCRRGTEEVYESLDDEAKQRLDDSFDACDGERSCDFIACVTGAELTYCTTPQGGGP
ncbi:MAG: hypothetical protein AAF715_14215 [Myxococcota bacterium]